MLIVHAVCDATSELEVVVSESVTVIDPFTTVEVVADTNGSVLVCSRWLSSVIE